MIVSTISCGPPILIESGEKTSSPTWIYPGAVDTITSDLIGTFFTKYWSRLIFILLGETTSTNSNSKDSGKTIFCRIHMIVLVV